MVIDGLAMLRQAGRLEHVIIAVGPAPSTVRCSRLKAAERADWDFGLAFHVAEEIVLLLADQRRVVVERPGESAHEVGVVLARILDDIRQRIRLRPDEWKSGDIAWIVDLAGNPAGFAAAAQWMREGPFKGRDAWLALSDGRGGARVEALANQEPGGGERRMRRIRVVTMFLVAGALGLEGCGSLFPSVVLHYKLAVDVDVDGVIHHGEGVYRVNFQSQGPLPS